jgi:hypothetical protein
MKQHDDALSLPLSFGRGQTVAVAALLATSVEILSSSESDPTQLDSLMRNNSISDIVQIQLRYDTSRSRVVFGLYGTFAYQHLSDMLGHLASATAAASPEPCNLDAAPDVYRQCPWCGLRSAR